MNIDLDIDIRALNRIELVFHGVYDVDDADVFAGVNAVRAAMLAVMKCKKRGLPIGIDLHPTESDRVVASVRTTHGARWSMNKPALEAKARLEALGHTVTYTKTGAWTKAEKAAFRSRPVPGVNTSTIRG